MSVDHRKRTAWEMKKEYQQAMLTPYGYKRLTAAEHCARVRFDPNSVK